MSSTEYRANTRDMKFILHEMLKIEDTLLKREAFADFGVDDINMILDEGAKFAETVLGPVNKEGDREGCRFDKGRVRVPKVYHEAYRKYRENGWNAVGTPVDAGGQGLPSVVATATGEMMTGACTSLGIYSGLTNGAARLIHSFGSDDLKERFMARMFSGEWTGTMQLTEPNAGSAVGDSKSVAKRAGDHYLVSGTKIFISGAEQDLTENIVHAVLARVEGAPAGVKGLSLFIVPKIRVNPDGSLGEPNDVSCGGIEEKIGLHGSATCLVNLGENDACHGYLLGEENQGIRLMFQMMNEARIGTGLQGVALASGAYLNCLSYTKERVQGVAVENMKDPDAPRVEIIKHPDVRRMLLAQKAYVEGMRAMLCYCAFHVDMAETARDKEEHEKHMQIVELLTPICKAYCTDMGFRCTELAIQAMGGYGCTADYPVEQYMRDLKPASIYEGTTGIQALDLLGRKVAMKGGSLFMNFIGILGEFVETHKGNGALKPLVAKLATARDKLSEITMHLGGLSMAGDRIYPVLSATPYLYLFGDVLMAYLHVWQAVIAREKLDSMGKKPEEDAEAAFYAGKVMGARFFVNNLLPQAFGLIEAIMNGDRSALEIAEESF
jgi:alkylation response protein AidB-like acyl-CoA dehydrogenase